MNKIGIKRVIEFSDFFLDEEPLDIPSVLKTFSRDRLVRMATLLSLQYGNMLFPNSKYTLFSCYSQKHEDILNKQCLSYFKATHERRPTSMFNLFKDEKSSNKSRSK